MRKGLTPDLVKSNFLGVDLTEFDKFLKKGKEKIKGGKADGMKCKDIAKKHGVKLKDIKAELKVGIKHEMEHTDDKVVAKEIALDHIAEDASYYVKLAKIENK